MKDRRGTIRRKPKVQDYPSGSDAPLRATEMALQRAQTARALVLVEGISDQIAVEAAALRCGRDLAGEGVVVVPAGGVGSIGALAARFGPAGAGVTLAGLCDAAEVVWVGRALLKAGVGVALDRAGLERLGFFVCDRDLEDEMTRAMGADQVEAALEAGGDLGAFRTLQRQGTWREADFADQVRRFLGAGARRKLRYAGAFVAAVALDRMPAPLVAVLARVAGVAGGASGGVQPDAQSGSE